jgi:hypothetical protein
VELTTTGLTLGDTNGVLEHLDVALGTEGPDLPLLTATDGVDTSGTTRHCILLRVRGDCSPVLLLSILDGGPEV